MRIALIGSGRVAGSFAPYLAQIGKVLVWSRNKEHAKDLARKFPLIAVDQEELEADLAFVCVSDDALPSVVHQFQNRFAAAIHTSGFHTSQVLGAMAEAVGSLHPWLPIPEQDPMLLKDALATWEGSESLKPLAERLAQTIPLRLYPIDPAKKIEYHAAAVLLSNYTNALMIKGEKLLADAGIPVPPLFVKELVCAAVKNYERLGHNCLTGPAARHDVEVVEAERKALGLVWGKLYWEMALIIMEGRI